MLSIISISLFAFITCFSCVLTFRPIAIGVGLVDKPNGRKQHNGEIPLVGGLAIYVAVIFSSFLFIPFDSNYKLYLISTSFMVLIGALDDYYDLDSGLRLIAQFLIASLMVFGAGLYISNLGDLFGLGDLELGLFGPIFTLLAVVVAINAFNMTDGVDGLVGTLSINTFLSIGVLALIADAPIGMELPAILFGAVFAFLFFNVGRYKNGRYKVFMGDAGSMLLGLTSIWLLTYSTQNSQGFISPVNVLWIIAIPLMDMLSVIIKRMLAGNSPLKASRDHLHHILLGKGFSPLKTTVSIGVFSAVTSIVGILFNYLNISERISLLSFLSVFYFYYLYTSNQDNKITN